VSTSDTGEESVETSASNGTDSKGGTVSDAVTGTCGEKYETLKEHDIGRQKILFGKGIITLVSFLSSRIPKKNTFDRSRRQSI